MLYGGKGPTAAQRAAIIPLIAACMEVLGKGYTGGSVAMHREFSTSRSDPQFFKGYEIRKAVNLQLAKWQSVVEKPSPTTPSAPTGDISMADAASLEALIRAEAKKQDDRYVVDSNRYSDLSTRLSRLESLVKDLIPADPKPSDTPAAG
jgi:hypothetical protein